MIKSNVFVAVTFCLSTVIHAHTAHRHDSEKFNTVDEVIETRDGVEAHSVDIDEIYRRLAKADAPGHAYLYDDVKERLMSMQTRRKSSPRFLFALAKVQQYEHEFDMARKTLQQSLTGGAHDVNVYLLLSRLHVVLRDYAKARRACMSLVGRSDGITSSICLLDVESFDGQLQRSYQRLKRLIELPSFAAWQKHWASQVLADMAYRLGKVEESEYWLDRHFDTTRSHFLIEWADVKLERNKAREVLDILTPLVSGLPALEDGMLLRLAIAERDVADHALAPVWQARAAARFRVREARQDRHHAGDLARYYLELAINPEKALYWAKINWEQAQEFRDRRLLIRAEKLAG